MPINRLDLDFNIQSSADRAAYVNQYIQRPDFRSHPLTQSELSKIADYVLWGRNENGTNLVQDHSIEIETKNGTWDRKDIESLDALVESPTFKEPTYTTQPIRYRTPREVFSRQRTRETAPTPLVQVYEELWHRIDETELLANLYEMNTGKRKTDPRPELLRNFSEQDLSTLKEKAVKLPQYEYLKLRHLLVELRREQYTLRDTFLETIHAQEIEPSLPVETIQLDVDVPVLPAGLAYPSSKLFPSDYPLPAQFEEKELTQVLRVYWSKHKLQGSSNRYFDFRELEHVYEAFQLMDEFENDDPFSTSPYFLDTLNWYVARASLSDTQRDILNLKVQKYHNQDIADIVNARYSKSYTANYISTIFRQKIIPAINEAARLHAEIIENLPYPENFKQCRCCGRTLLLSADNFVRKARSSNGFNSQCKRCDSEERTRRKNTSMNYKKVNE